MCGVCMNEHHTTSVCKLWGQQPRVGSRPLMCRCTVQMRAAAGSISTEQPQHTHHGLILHVAPWVVLRRRLLVPDVT